MIGANSIQLNQATVKQIFEDYLNHTLFEKEQFPVAVESVDLMDDNQTVDITFKTLPPKVSE